MATLHQNFVDLATRLINKNGRAVTLTRTTITPDPIEPWKPASTSVQASATKAVTFQNSSNDFLAILTQVAGRGDQEVTSLDGNQILQVMISAEGLSFDPTTDDTLVDGGVTWEITDVGFEQPGPTKIVFYLKMKR